MSILRVRFSELLKQDVYINTCCVCHQDWDCLSLKTSEWICEECERPDAEPDTYGLRTPDDR